MVKNVSFRSITVKWEVSGGIRDRRVVGVEYYWVGWKNCLVYDVEVLDQAI